MKFRTHAQLDLDEETPCPHEARAGIVTNQPGAYDPHNAHAAVAVCPDPSCRARAMGWVYRITGEQGIYISDSDRPKEQ